MKPLTVTEAREVSQIKPRLGQGRAGLRCKIRTPMATPISKPIVQMTKNRTSRIQDKILPIPNYTVPHIRSRDGSCSRMVNRKTMQDINKELLTYPCANYRPPPKPVKSFMPEVPRSLSDIDPEINLNFEENSPFQEGVISETYQRPDKSYFQDPQELDSLINTGRLVQKFLLKQLIYTKY